MNVPINALKVASLLALLVCSSCSEEEVSNDIIDVARLLEFSPGAKSETMIPLGFGGFEIKKHLLYGNAIGPASLEGNLLYILPSNRVGKRDSITEIVADFEKWADTEEAGEVRVWIDGRTFESVDSELKMGEPFPASKVPELLRTFHKNGLFGT